MGEADAAPTTVSLLPVFVAKPEHSAQLLEELIELESASRADPGCIQYQVFRDTERADRFVLMEEWTDSAALQSHNEQPHVLRFLASSAGLLAEPFVVTRLAPAG